MMPAVHGDLRAAGRGDDGGRAPSRNVRARGPPEFLAVADVEPLRPKIRKALLSMALG
jgi:hypothetical protein